MRRSYICYFIFLLLIFTGLAKGQDGVSLNILDIRSKPEGNVEMLVSALDGEGIPIKGLQKSKFKLNLEGKKIEEFSVEPVFSSKSPLSVILGIDVSGSMKGVPMKEAQKAAFIFLDQLEKEDLVSLMVFGNEVKSVADFTQKKYVIREKIEGLSAKEMSTWLYQATHECLEKASQSPTARVAIVLLTDGKDEGSPKTEEEVFARIREVQVPIYTLSFGPKTQVEYLKRIAYLSGGYFFFTPNPEELSKLYDLVLDQLKNQYLIQFIFHKPAGEYTAFLSMNSQGQEAHAQRVFLHTPSEPMSW